MTKKEIDNVLSGIGCDSLNRFAYFLKIAHSCKGANYWYALQNAYTGSDNLYYLRNLVKDAFLSNEPNREKLMNRKELKHFNSLPEKFTIFRGMTEFEATTKDYGLSWTLNKDVAVFFCEKYERNYSTNHLKRVVIEIEVNKSDVIAFLNNRKEFEIIYIKVLR